MCACVYLCVCVRERGRERERERVCACERERACVCVCLCINACMWVGGWLAGERERERLSPANGRECVCLRDDESACKRD